MLLLLLFAKKYESGQEKHLLPMWKQVFLEYPTWVKPMD